jgi:hypothetical protein
MICCRDAVGLHWREMRVPGTATECNAAMHVTGACQCNRVVVAAVGKQFFLSFGACHPLFTS